jgi:predicted Zn-dependent peptidase
MFSTPKKYNHVIVSLGYQGDREDFTAGELSDIEAAAKRGAEQVKRTAAESKATKRRLARALVA